MWTSSYSGQLMKSNKLENAIRIAIHNHFILCMMFLVHLVLLYSAHPITDSRKLSQALTSFHCIKRTGEQVCLVLRISQKNTWKDGLAFERKRLM